LIADFIAETNGRQHAHYSDCPFVNDFEPKFKELLPTDQQKVHPRLLSQFRRGNVVIMGNENMQESMFDSDSNSNILQHLPVESQKLEVDTTLFSLRSPESSLER
jgi:hypothetical protein